MIALSVTALVSLFYAWSMIRLHRQLMILRIRVEALEKIQTRWEDTAAIALQSLETIRAKQFPGG